MHHEEIVQMINKCNKQRNGYIEKALESIQYAALSSCLCITKTPDPQYHQDTCTYKKLKQAETLLESCIVK